MAIVRIEEGAEKEKVNEEKGGHMTIKERRFKLCSAVGNSYRQWMGAIDVYSCEGRLCMLC